MLQSTAGVSRPERDNLLPDSSIEYAHKNAVTHSQNPFDD
jgi:hypothetical protein